MRSHEPGCAKAEKHPNHHGICRDKRGRPRIVVSIGPKGGKTVRSYSRASSLGKVLDDKESLMGWKCLMTAYGAIEQPDLLRMIDCLRDDVSEEGKKKKKALVAQLLEAGGATYAANRGTEVHELSEDVDAGREYTARDRLMEQDLWAYEITLQENGLYPLLSEVFVVQDELGVAGTFDRILDVPIPDPDGVIANRVGDLKTSSTSNYHHAWAIQMAAYANSKIYNPETYERTDLPNVNTKWAVLLHLPAEQGLCYPHWINIEAGWEMAMTGIPMVKAWRARKDLLVPLVGDTND